MRAMQIFIYLSMKFCPDGRKLNSKIVSEYRQNLVVLILRLGVSFRCVVGPYSRCRLNLDKVHIHTGTVTPFPWASLITIGTAQNERHAGDPDHGASFLG